MAEKTTPQGQWTLIVLRIVFPIRVYWQKRDFYIWITLRSFWIVHTSPWPNIKSLYHLHLSYIAYRKKNLSAHLSHKAWTSIDRVKSCNLMDITRIFLIWIGTSLEVPLGRRTLKRLLPSAAPREWSNRRHQMTLQPEKQHCKQMRWRAVREKTTTLISAWCLPWMRCNFSGCSPKMQVE